MRKLASIAIFCAAATTLASAGEVLGKITSGGAPVGEGTEVAAKCGDPDDVVTLRSIFRRPVIWTGGRPYYVGDDFIEVPVESWVYNFGPNKLMRRVIFEGGYVTAIETLGYGYNK